MAARIGIDVGGTFTDFILTRDDAPPVLHKVLSTPADPSIAVVDGPDRARGDGRAGESVEAFAATIDTIVHGTTVTTNATLTAHRGEIGAAHDRRRARRARDAPRHPRGAVQQRLHEREAAGAALSAHRRRRAARPRRPRAGAAVARRRPPRARRYFQQEGVEAVSICFMNSFANPAHEEAAAELVREAMPDAYPHRLVRRCCRRSASTSGCRRRRSIRTSGRSSTTTWSSSSAALRAIDFRGLLLIMQSNGGVMAPEVARSKPALTLLSGPAGGPGAGLFYARALGQNKAITTDMGGTSFEASVAVDAPILVNDGEIARHKIALPMLDIHTIGAGGGSIGWIDPGGLLRMGPQSAGADPGPACYMKGGTLPASHRRQPRARLSRPRLFRRRADAAVGRRGARRHRRRTSPGRWGCRSRRPRRGCTASSATTWRRACAR